MQKIFLALLLVSFSILVYFLIKKAPELTEFKEESSKKKLSPFLKIKKRISKISFLKNISWNIILQRVLSKTRVALLKIENKIGDRLHFLRKKSKKKDELPG